MIGFRTFHAQYSYNIFPTSYGSAFGLVAFSPLTNIDETTKVVKPITIMATTHPASSPALSRLRTVWPSQTLMRLYCSPLSTDLVPRFVLAVLFEVPGYVLSCESFPALTVTARSVPIFSRHCCPHN